MTPVQKVVQILGTLNPPPKNQQPPETSREYVKNMGFSRGFSMYEYIYYILYILYIFWLNYNDLTVRPKPGNHG